MNMMELTCSNNLNSRLTGDIGKKPNLENPVYSNNPSSILTDATGLQVLYLKETINENKANRWNS